MGQVGSTEMPTPRICADCKWFVRGPLFGGGYRHGCAHPRALDIVTGRPDDAHDKRYTNGGCGPSGAWWAAR